MPKRSMVLPFPSKGFTKEPPGRLAAKEYFNAAQNVRVVDGSIAAGFPPDAGSSVTGGLVNGMGYFHVANGDSLAFAANKTGIFLYDIGTGTWVSQTSAITFTGDDFDLWNFAESFDWFYACNNIDGIYRVNGSGPWLSFDTTYNCRYMTGFAGRLIIGDVTGLSGQIRDRIRWTSLGSTPNFADGSYLDLVEIHGPLTGVGPIGTALYAYKNSAIWRLTETGLTLPTFTSTIVHQGIGCYGGRTLAKTPVGHIFLGADFNVYRFDGSAAPQPIGGPVQDYIRDRIDTNYGERAYGIAYPQLHEYWLLIPDSSGWATEVLTFDWQTNTWGKLERAASLGEVPVVGMRNLTEDAETWGSEIVLDWNSETVLTWGANVTPGEDLRPIVSNRDGTSLDEVRFDDLSQGVTPAWSFELVENVLEKSGLNKTVERVILHGYACKGTSNLSVQLSIDGGVTWGGAVLVSAIVSSTPQRWIFNLARLTGENFKIRVAGTEPFKFHAIEVEVHNREGIR